MKVYELINLLREMPMKAEIAVQDFDCDYPTQSISSVREWSPKDITWAPAEMREDLAKSKVRVIIACKP